MHIHVKLPTFTSALHVYCHTRLVLSMSNTAFCCLLCLISTCSSVNHFTGFDVPSHTPAGSWAPQPLHALFTGFHAEGDGPHVPRAPAALHSSCWLQRSGQHDVLESAGCYPS